MLPAPRLFVALREKMWYDGSVSGTACRAAREPRFKAEKLYHKLRKREGGHPPFSRKGTLMPTIIEQLARELDRPVEHVENVVKLLDEGNTIPFIARYRKELHGSMDDTALRTLEERLAYLRNLSERKESVKASIAEQEKLTDELAAAIDAAGEYAFREMFYDFIARQAKPRVQATALLLSRLAERGEPNVRRYPAILCSPALRKEV